MPPAELNEVLASPFDSTAIGPYFERTVLVYCRGLRPKYNLSSNRAVSKGEILILAADDVRIESADVVKQISGDGHISGRAEIAERRGTWDSGHDTVFKFLSKLDKGS
jgi:hypothetical protein